MTEPGYDEGWPRWDLPRDMQHDLFERYYGVLGRFIHYFSNAERAVNQVAYHEELRASWLGRVKLEPLLMKIAQTQADAMAAQDTMSHDLPGLGGLKERLRAGDYKSSVAAENLGAGYRSLGAAFVGWRGSAGHRENLLRADVTQLGIALAQTPRGRFKVYWAMVVAAPSAKRQVSDAAGSLARGQ
jgi:uncharacterized protein YkwD